MSLVEAARIQQLDGAQQDSAAAAMETDPTKSMSVLSPKLFLGDVGSGKTLMFAQLGLQEAEKGREVYANFDLTEYAKQKYPSIAAHWHYVENIPLFFRERLILASTKDFKPFQDMLLIDEGYVVFESRESMTPFVLLMTRLIFLSRKLGFELFVSAQLSSSLDKRVRFLSEMWVLAEKQVLEDGTPNFLYHRWIVHAVSTELQEIPAVQIEWYKAQELFKCYNSTRISESELTSTLSELNALLLPGGQERADMPVDDMDANLLALHLVRYLSLHQMTPRSTQELASLDEFRDYKPSQLNKALGWLYEQKLVAKSDTKRGLRTWTVWK